MVKVTQALWKIWESLPGVTLIFALSLSFKHTGYIIIILPLWALIFAVVFAYAFTERETEFNIEFPQSAY